MASLVDEAFAHHVWASLRLIDACLPLTAEQLDTTVPGTYGSILDTVRHFVGGDAYYLFHLTGDPTRQIDEDHMDLGELRAAMEANERAWTELLAGGLDPDDVVTDVDSAGYRREASVGVRLAQALMHGTEHRSQVCTAITTIGIEPPSLDVWDYGDDTGRVIEIPPES